MSNRIASRAVPQPLFRLTGKSLEFAYVSEQSMWVDKIWRFDNDAGGARPSTINWEIGFETCWNDSRCQHLVNQGRRLINAMRNLNSRLKYVTLCDYGMCICYLLRWMYVNHYDNFSELSRKVCLYYISDLVVDKIGHSEEDCDTVLVNTLAKYIDILHKIFRLAPIFNEMDYLKIPENPLGGRSAWLIAREYAVKEANRIPAIPRQMYNPIVSMAQEWIEVRSKDIIDTQSELIFARNQVAHLRGNSKTYHIDKHLKKFRFDNNKNLSEPWRPPITGHQLERRSFRGVVSEQKKSPSQQIRALVRDLTMAAYICIQAGTGIRVSEMAGLRALPYRKDGLPFCVEVKPSSSGLYEIFYISGWTYKAIGKDQQRIKVEWVAGARPIGTNWIPFPIQAIMVLDSLYAPWREMFEDESLVVSLPSAGLPHARRPNPKILCRTILDGQNSFIHTHVDLPQEFAYYWVTTHMWRKRFAQDLISFDPEMLKAVSEHFQHLSEVVTEQAYGGDAMLRRLIDSTAVRDAASIYHDAIYGRATIGGNSTKRIFDYEPWVRERLDGTSSKDDQIGVLVDVLREDGVRLFDNEYGGCLFRANTARCHHDHHGHFDFLATRPLGTTRRPQLCGSCSNLVITERHVRFWQMRHAENRKILEENISSDRLPIRIIAKERMLLAERILERMEKLPKNVLPCKKSRK